MADQLILIIEDNERNLKLVRDVLQFSGFRTAEARTAEDGLALASASPPTAAIPVVAVTALAMKDDRERVLRAGFDGYLEKPISVRELPGQVRAFLTAAELPDDR